MASDGSVSVASGEMSKSSTRPRFRAANWVIAIIGGDRCREPRLLRRCLGSARVRNSLQSRRKEAFFDEKPRTKEPEELTKKQSKECRRKCQVFLKQYAAQESVFRRENTNADISVQAQENSTPCPHCLQTSNSQSNLLKERSTYTQNIATRAKHV